MVNIPELIVQKPGLHTELSCITQKDLNASDICVNVPKSVGDLWHFQWMEQNANGCIWLARYHFLLVFYVDPNNGKSPTGSIYIWSSTRLCEQFLCQLSDIHTLYVGTQLWENNNNSIKILPITDKFVDFVKQKDWVANTDVFQSLNDASRHGPYVRPPMTSNVRLITDAAECNSVPNITFILALECTWFILSLPFTISCPSYSSCALCIILTDFLLFSASSVKYLLYLYSFSALTLLVGRQEGHLACKNWVVECWRGCLGWGADLHIAQQMPLPLTISCSSKSDWF